MQIILLEASDPHVEVPPPKRWRDRKRATPAPGVRPDPERRARVSTASTCFRTREPRVRRAKREDPQVRAETVPSQGGGGQKATFDEQCKSRDPWRGRRAPCGFSGASAPGQASLYAVKRCNCPGSRVSRQSWVQACPLLIEQLLQTHGPDSFGVDMLTNVPMVKLV